MIMTKRSTTARLTMENRCLKTLVRLGRQMVQGKDKFFLLSHFILTTSSCFFDERLASCTTSWRLFGSPLTLPLESLSKNREESSSLIVNCLEKFGFMYY